MIALADHIRATGPRAGSSGRSVCRRSAIEPRSRTGSAQAIGRGTRKRQRIGVSVTIINGGTQGLGEATARKLARRGATGLVLAGRSADRGEALAAELIGRRHADGLRRGRHGGRRVAGADRRRVRRAVRRRARRRERRRADRSQHGVERHARALRDQIMAINVRAPFFVLQARRRADAARGRARDRSSTSVRCARYGGPTRLLAYSVSKGALAMMTRTRPRSR